MSLKPMHIVFHLDPTPAPSCMRCSQLDSEVQRLKKAMADQEHRLIQLQEMNDNQAKMITDRDATIEGHVNHIYSLRKQLADEQAAHRKEIDGKNRIIKSRDEECEMRLKHLTEKESTIKALQESNEEMKKQLDAAARSTISPGVAAVAVERGRQLRKKWDDNSPEHRNRELSKCGARILHCYNTGRSDFGPTQGVWELQRAKRVVEKYHDPLRQLAIAAALIVAEYDRISKATEATEAHPGNVEVTVDSDMVGCEDVLGCEEELENIQKIVDSIAGRLLSLKERGAIVNVTIKSGKIK